MPPVDLRGESGDRIRYYNKFKFIDDDDVVVVAVVVGIDDGVQ